MKEEKRAVLQSIRKEFKTDDKLEQLVMGMALKKMGGSRKDDDGVFYSKNGRKVTMSQKSLSGVYKVKEGIRTIDDDAFWGCAYLEGIELPEGLETIGNEAFGKCISLKQVTLPSSLKKMGVNPFVGFTADRISSMSPEFVIDGMALYNKDKTRLIACLTDQEQMDVPEGVRVIGEKAFVGRKRLRKVTLPVTLEVIEDEAFFDCDALEQVELPVSVHTVSDLAFADCASLRMVTFLGVPAAIKRNMLADCDALRKIVVPAGMTGKFKKMARYYDDRVVETTAASSVQQLVAAGKPAVKGGATDSGAAAEDTAGVGAEAAVGGKAEKDIKPAAGHKHKAVGDVEHKAKEKDNAKQNKDEKNGKKH